MEPQSQAGDNAERSVKSEIEQEYQEDEECELTLNHVLQMIPPREVQKLLFERLHFEDKIRCRTVCELWKDFVDETIVISPLFSDASADAVLKFGSTGARLERLTVTALQEFVYPKDGLGFSSIRTLALEPCMPDDGAREDPLYFGISEANLAHLLKEYSNIEEFEVHSGSLTDISCPSILQTVQLPCLKTLTMSTFNLDGHGFVVKGDILKNTFPGLESVDLTILNREDNDVQTPLYYEECYRFIANHAKTLKEISLHHSNLFDEADIEWHQLLLDHSMSQPAYLDLLKQVETVQVSSIDLTTTCYEGNSRFQFGVRLLKAQTSLVTLKLFRVTYFTVGLWSIVPDILRQCSGTLQEVVVEGCFCPMEATLGRFSCTTIKNCRHLKKFCMRLCGLQVLEIEDLPRQIEVLSLGQSLTRSQLNFITGNMKALVTFDLPQGKSRERGSLAARITEGIFKQILKLPRLTELILNKASCASKRIRRIVSYTPGIEEEGVVPDTYENFALLQNKTYMRMVIDRSVLDCSRL